MRYFIIILSIFLLLGCESKQQNNSTKDFPDKKLPEKKIFFGSVSINFKNEELVMKPLENYVLEQMKEFGYTEAISVIARSIEDLISKAKNDSVDVFFGSLYPTVMMDNATQLKPILKIWQGTTDSYRTVFYTQKSNSLENIENLNGKVVTMEREFSTSGYLVPKIILLKKGFRLVKVESPGSTVDKNSVGYCFSNDDENTAAWVLNYKSEIGVSDDDSFKKYSGMKRDSLKIIFTSQKLLRNLASINQRLPDQEKRKLVEIFLKITNTETGRKATERFFNLSKFEKLDSSEYTDLKLDFDKYIFKVR